MMRVSLLISNPTAVTVVAASVMVTVRSVLAMFWSGITCRKSVRTTSSLDVSWAARVTRTSSWKYTCWPFEDTTASDAVIVTRSEEHTSELQSQSNLVCRLLLEKKKEKTNHKQRNTHHQQQTSLGLSSAPV